MPDLGAHFFDRGGEAYRKVCLVEYGHGGLGREKRYPEAEVLLPLDAFLEGEHLK